MSLAAFNRVLARHLATALKAGADCDADLITRCYATARRDVRLPNRLADDPLAMEIRMMCVTHDLHALKQNERKLRRLTLREAEGAIFHLLNPDLRVAESESSGSFF